MADSDDLTQQISALTSRLESVLGELEAQRVELKRLTLARALDADELDKLRTLHEVWDIRAIETHMREVIRSTPVFTDPFPHLVIEPLLPPKIFQALLEAVPREDFFDGEKRKHLDMRGIGLTSTVAPLYSTAIWSSFRWDIVRRVLGPLLGERFRPHAREFLRLGLGEDLVDEALALPLQAHGLRLMLRRPGWRLAPHLDPRDQFITTLLYLARPGEPETYGTQLFRVHRDNFVSAYANTYYPEEDGIRCELVKTMPYRGNLCLSFLNMGGGAHGASVPADAEPANLRRIVFQFYLGPERERLEALVQRLPPERQVAWTERAGKRALRAKHQAAGGSAV